MSNNRLTAPSIWLALLSGLLSACGCLSDPVGFERLPSLDPKALNGSLTQFAVLNFSPETDCVMVPQGTHVTYSSGVDSAPVVVLYARKTAANNGHLREKFDATELFDNVGVMFRECGSTVELREYGTLSVGNRELMRTMELHVEVPPGVRVVEDKGQRDLNWIEEPHPLPGWQVVPWREISVDDYAARTS